MASQNSESRPPVSGPEAFLCSFDGELGPGAPVVALVFQDDDGDATMLLGAPGSLDRDPNFAGLARAAVAETGDIEKKSRLRERARIVRAEIESMEDARQALDKDLSPEQR